MYMECPLIEKFLICWRASRCCSQRWKLISCTERKSCDRLSQEVHSAPKRRQKPILLTGHDSWSVGLHDIWVVNVSTLPCTFSPCCCSKSLVFELAACLAFPPLASLFHRNPPPRSAARAGEETLRALILPRLETSSKDLLAEATASGWIGVSRARSSDIEGQEAPQGRDMCTIGIICRW